ncbi:unnamed protein product, partial [Porites evermanni]
MSHLEHYNLLYHSRHGFHTFKSSELQLIELVSDITSSYKLENYGIKGETLRWIKAFLKKPQQSVVVDDERSVFQAYVNNLLRNIRSRVLRITVHIRSKQYSAMWLDGGYTDAGATTLSSVINMLEDLGWRTLGNIMAL